MTIDFDSVSFTAMMYFASLLFRLTLVSAFDDRRNTTIGLEKLRREIVSTLRYEPGHHIGDVLRRHRLVRHVSPPVRLPEVLSAGDRRRAQ